MRTVSGKWIILYLLLSQMAVAQQINISRVEQMPNFPQPYQMRNWEQVALGYDSLVFNLQASGQYLPLVWTDNNSVNYPNHPRFGMQSYVGHDDDRAAEAINVIPAVVGASLVGIDKSNQDGKNWVLMCEEFFNRRPEENVYLNNFINSSGSDWWYETMPNVFFYQLYDLYPGMGDFDYQFVTVADRWREAIVTMGASTSPWKQPYMNYRAWKLSTMKPLSEGVRQPEAAGALAWIQYMAWVKTGNEAYRISAEWAMEFLSDWRMNPAYELQLSYGAYCAARMNAELGTNYDVGKILNWCFDPKNNERQWGVTLGNWGGYDCAGLVGEALYEGYAFNMNGLEQAGALLPLVRYDDRFARAIGKWLLNCANASRLFYSRYLPDQNQDSETWSATYDPNSYIGYESMREKEINSDIQPFATGDAIRGGWAATNLALYGSSHVGILGAIIDTTDVTGILQLDLLKTDYFGAAAYPSFLFYNPHQTDTTFTIHIGPENKSIYDAVSNTFIAERVSEDVVLSIGADQALLAVITPAGGSAEYELNRMLIDGVVVDYNAGDNVENYPPRIKALAAKQTTISKLQTLNLYCAADDRNNETLHFDWKTEDGLISGEGAQVQWTSPDMGGVYRIRCVVTDDMDSADSAYIDIEVLENRLPVIQSLSTDQPEIDISEFTLVTCQASDPDGDSLNYDWSCRGGTFIGTGPVVQWRAPDQPGYYYIACLVSDSSGASMEDSTGVAAGHLIAEYNFNGNATDLSGYNHHGQLSGAKPAPDQHGTAASALLFDGNDDNVRVPATEALNFSKAITVACWLRVDDFFERESYPLSHGNWENRWKISITDQGIRWTVKSSTGIKDLDSETKLTLGQFYHVACVYDGENFEIFINGQLDNHSTFSGSILKTSIDLMIGQALPTNSAYNFKGVIDEVRIYNCALDPDNISDLYQYGTALPQADGGNTVMRFGLDQNYPNPFNPQTVITYTLTANGPVSLTVYDARGRLIETLVNRIQAVGKHQIIWKSGSLASGIYFYRLEAEGIIRTRKCLKLK